MSRYPLGAYVPMAHTREWWNGPGVVYLLHCAGTDVFKVGASSQPVTRIGVHRVAAKKKYGCDLRFVSAVVTNGIGRLEEYLLRRWHPYRVGPTRREWFRLPQEEVRMFRSVGLYTWKDLTAVGADVRAKLTGFPGKKHFS